MRHVPNAPRAAILATIAILAATPLAAAQDRLKTMPGYENYQKMSRQIPGSVKMGVVNGTWRDGGKALEYRKDGKTLRLDLATGTSAEAKPGGGSAGEDVGGRFGFIERGRQAASATSPDGHLKAYHKDRNLWISDVKGAVEHQVTTDGSEAKRIKNGIASWVYGEELFQNSAIWWSPDSKKVAFYRFDESGVKDYYLQLNQTKLQSTIDVEPYPKSGTPNPIVDLLIYDVASKSITRADVRDGKPFADDAVGYYVYKIMWSPDGKEILFHRTNRRQNVLDLAACDPKTGTCRTIVRDEWPASWVENLPKMQFLKDNNRFLYESERNGFKNYYLYDLTGKLHNAVTSHDFEVERIVRVDEAAGTVDYLAHDGDNPIKLQLHRVGLDGKNHKRLTDPKYHHTVNIAPDGKHFVDVIQTHDEPPVTRVVSEDGKVVAELGRSDTSKFESLGLQKVEIVKFKAGDGTTDLYGLLHKPSHFDPKKKYPMLVTVYAGPATNAARETFTMPSALAEYGFLVASFDARSAAGRGKKFLDAIYEKLGITEIDDLAAGVKSLWDRPYVDKNRVGIFGTSYGGYASIMALLRHPEAFQAACASSPVTDWRHYDTIYTERYMWTPQGNKKGYDAGSAMTYADDLKGRLMIFYGTADNNVHPSNAMQLIQALQRAGKSFDVMVGPDMGHSAINNQRMMEFFIENLVMKAR